jgi:uncharacterized protein YecT (DUF1311 family)
MNFTIKLRLPFLLALWGLALLAVPHPLMAQTQSEMNTEAAEDFTKADRVLNETYKAVVEQVDEESRVLLKSAQKAWIAYRDAEAKFQADLEARGGSMYPLSLMAYKTTLTQQRTAELEQLLESKDSE